jgi:hypothetical protein
MRVALIGAFALLGFGGVAQGAPVGGPPAGQAPGPDAKALAAALVSDDGALDKTTKAVEKMEALLANQAARQLSASDPATVEKIRVVVHQALAAIPSRVVEAETRAYAANYSAQELRDILAFERGPAGAAMKANLPLFKMELGNGLASDADIETTDRIAKATFAGASPQVRQLILRIVKAEDLERETRAGYPRLKAALAAAFPSLPKDEGADQPDRTPAQTDAQKAQDAKSEDADVQMVVAVKQAWYTKHFSEDQLRAVALYSESDAGQAARNRRGAVQRAAAGALGDELSTAFPAVEKGVCAAVACTTTQAAQLDELLTGIKAAMADSAKVIS